MAMCWEGTDLHFWFQIHKCMCRVFCYSAFKVSNCGLWNLQEDTLVNSVSKHSLIRSTINDMNIHEKQHSH